MFNSDYFSTTNINGASSVGSHSLGLYVAISNIVTKVIAEKAGVELREVSYSTGIDHYEIIIDGEFINRFKSLKIAKSMFKDFAGC